ncbi:MAG: WD40 repeat domain-containing protein [Ruminococcaceae bacterium]|nr:WD40 repeat domain-containing protein [Oscillospiraceae bacterium]
MDYLIKSEGAVLGFCIKKHYIDFLCGKTLYKMDKESKTVVCKKEIFEKEGLARIMAADENRIYISDFCTLYVLNGEDYEILGKWKIGEDLSSDICGMVTDEKKIYCSIRNGRIITVDKSFYDRNEYIVSDASMWSLKIFNNCLLCGTVDGQLLLLNKETMAVEKKLTLSKHNIRSLYVNGTILYAACQDKKLFKIDLTEFKLLESQKNVHKKMFDCVGLYDDMLVTVSYPCGEIALWDMNTLEKRKEIKTPLSLNGNAYIEGDKLYIASRNIYGIGRIYLK